MGSPGQGSWSSHKKLVFSKWEFDHDFELARWILMNVVAFRVKTMRTEILKARDPGKFYSQMLTALKVGENDKIFGKTLAGEL